MKNKHEKHKIKVHKWENGRLCLEELEYDTLEIALRVAETIIEGEVKIYNELEELVHCINRQFPWCEPEYA